MRYTLAVVTHGEAPTLEDAVRSFAAGLSPRPSALLCVVDGPGRLPTIEPLGSWLIEQSAVQEGFCAATRRLWGLASRSESEYVLWLENDFVLLAPLNLEPLAAVLDAEPTLAQMQLMREPVNREEGRAGGLFWFWRGHERWERREWGYVQSDYLTTNPSLMRRDFMAAHPWPEYDSECEGRFGIDLKEAGYAFGVWGDGGAFVRHVGRRRGVGY